MLGYGASQLGSTQRSRYRCFLALSVHLALPSVRKMSFRNSEDSLASHGWQGQMHG